MWVLHIRWLESSSTKYDVEVRSRQYVVAVTSSDRSQHGQAGLLLMDDLCQIALDNFRGADVNQVLLRGVPIGC